MAPPLYIDDCASSRLLHRLLEDAGYKVTIPADAGLVGVRDEVHAAYALEHGLVLITKNPDDCRSIYAGVGARKSPHPGVVLIYRDNDPSRDMSDADVVRALTNLISAGVPIAGEVHVLNHWRF